MLDRIELRRQEENGSETRVVADVHRTTVRIDITRVGKRTKHELDRAAFVGVLAHLDGAVAAPVPAHTSHGDPVGYEVILSAGMTQTVYRWVGSAPATWESVAALADDLLALASNVSPVP